MANITKILLILVVLLLDVLLSTKKVAAQDLLNPYSFKIGRDELAGVDIFDLLYHNNILYVASSEGFYTVKNNEITKYERLENQIGSSIFSLTVNEQDEIFYTNLSGQVFIFHKDKNKLIHTFKKEDLSYGVELNNIGSNTLVFISKKILFYETYQSKVRTAFFKGEELTGNFHGVAKINDSTIIAPFVKDSLYTAIIRPSGVRYRTICSLDSMSTIYYSYCEIDEKPYLMNIDGSLYNYTDGSYVGKIPFTTFQVKFLRHSTVVNGQEKGLGYLTKENGKHIFNSIFNNPNISCSHNDLSNPIFIGTFGEGVYVVPSTSIKEMIKLDNLELVNDFWINDSSVFYVNNKGKVYHYNSSDISKNLIYKGLDKNKTSLHFEPAWIRSASHPEEDLIFTRPLSETSTTNSDIINDHDYLPDSSLLLARYAGLSFLTNDTISSINHKFKLLGYIHESFTDKYKYHYLLQSNSDYIRGNSVCYNTIDNSILYASNSGLISVDSSWHINELKYLDKNIYATEIIAINDTIYIATIKNGVLLLDANQKLSRFTTPSLSGINEITDLQFQSGHFFVSTKNDIFIFSSSWKLQKRIGMNYGIKQNGISKFQIRGNQLYFLSHGHLYETDWKTIPKNFSDAKVNITNITFGKESDKSYDLQNIPFRSNSLKVYFEYNDVIRYHNFTVEYKIEGLSDKWTATENQYISIDYLPSGSYHFHIRIRERNQIISSDHFEFSINKPWYFQWWFILGAFLISATLLVIMYLWRVRIIKIRNKKKYEYQRLKLERAEFRLKSLRAQMNPHFVFNSLNAIQSLVLNREIDKSYEYLDIFSRLVRMSLIYSDTDFITLKDEIEFLELYLQLEHLRMTESFKFEIINELESSTYVPSMMVQPFIENSIQHGLLNKKGKKHLSLRFSETDNENIILCEVKDNGIGVEKSRDIKQHEYSSFSLGATEARMNTFNERYQLNTHYKFVKSDANGTIVHIFIPSNIYHA